MTRRRAHVAKQLAVRRLPRRQARAKGEHLGRHPLPVGARAVDAPHPQLADAVVDTVLAMAHAEPELNVLAVEVHQSSPSSSDLGFDAELTVKKPAP